MCSRPFPNFVCGRCPECRALRQTELVNQLQLELGLRPHSLFITLTYSDEYLPVFHHSKKAELYKPDLDAFCKRLRRALEPEKIKIFGVGEYGGRLFGSQNAAREIHPHYHIMVFATSKLVLGIIRRLLPTLWFMGSTHVLVTSRSLMSYITGYATKKLTDPHSMNRVMALQIRPEFRYGRGIGDISDQLMEQQEIYGEIPKIQMGNRMVHVPRYLKNKMKRKLLKFRLAHLDLEDPVQSAEAERIKYEIKIENLLSLRQKLKAQEAEILAAAGTDDIYEAKRLVRLQKLKNLQARIALKLQKETSL